MKCTRDPIQLGKMMVDIATGAVFDTANDERCGSHHDGKGMIPNKRREPMSIVADMSPENAISEMLDLVGSKNADSFSLSVVRCDDRWTVITQDLDSLAGRAIGKGECFAEAWFTQKPEYADTKRNQ